MICNATGKCTSPGKMQHPVDGRAWKNFDTKVSICKRPNNIGTTKVLAADGLNLVRQPYLFPNKDMKEEFPEWFGSQIRQRHVDNDKDPEVSTTSELFALACGPTWTPISINSCVVDEDDPDIIHFDNSSDLPLSTSLNDLDNATLHIDGQSTEMSADIAWSHGDNGNGEDHPPPHHIPTGCGGYFANRGKGKRKPSLGGRAAGRLNTRDKTWNLSLKEITVKKGLVPIRFETQFDLRPHMESPDWTEIEAGIQQQLAKSVQYQQGCFQGPALEEEWDKYIQFWNDPKNIARAKLQLAKPGKEHGHISTGILVACLALQDEMIKLSHSGVPVAD
ncbi:hypothetical protein Tco_0988246 [Tanacetum coccineum]|uniref:Uncharacterized protein n=1 Tax=Tanacetum coccineum TaxID=301880 RepID=A0ABQ5EQM2_9ASTR